MTPTPPGNPRRTLRPPAARGWTVGLLGLALVASGCVTPWEKSSLLGGRETTIDNVQGPTERGLRNFFRKKELEDYAAGNGSLKPIAGTEEYLAAEELYEAEEYDKAAAAFKKVARKYKKSEIREDALFMEAESQYNLGYYARAQDNYSELLRDYPSTRHLDDVSKRLFEIARNWLDFPEAADVGEVEQVNYDNFGDKLPPPAPVEKKGGAVAFWPNLTDPARPLFDPEGNGVGALRLIWLNDPTGPLADDALMLAASHYARSGNFIEADRHYTLLREEYPNSPHVQNAFVLGSHVKLMSYEGPDYDSKSLEDAEQLKESILRLYPNLEDRQRVEAELAKIELAKAAREWEQVVFYERKNNPRAQAVYCHLVIQRFPNSPYAQMARDRLKELGPEYVSGGKLLDPQPDQPKYRQTFGRPKAPLMNVPSSIREERMAAQPAPEPNAPRRLGNPFRRDAPAEGEEEGEEEMRPLEEGTEEAPRSAPRRFFPWGGDEEVPELAPESPGELTPPEEEETVSGEEPTVEAARPRSRFSLPRLLRPTRDAKPIIEEESEAEPAGTAEP